MYHSPGHTDTYHAEKLCAVKSIHDKEAEYTAGKRVQHSEDSRKEQARGHNSHTVYCKGVFKAHSVDCNYYHKVGQTQLDTRYRYRQRNEKFHIGKDESQCGKHSSESQPAGVP